MNLDSIHRAVLLDTIQDDPLLPPLRLARWRRSEEALRLHNAGLSYAEIARALGGDRTLAAWNVRQALARRGLKEPKDRVHRLRRPEAGDDAGHESGMDATEGDP